MSRALVLLAISIRKAAATKQLPKQAADGDRGMQYDIFTREGLQKLNKCPFQRRYSSSSMCIYFTKYIYMYLDNV